MTDPATLIADAAVSLAAAGGLGILIARIGGQGDGTGPIAGRMLAYLWVLLVLMLARVLHWVIGAGVFQLATILAAAVVPLTALMLAEGLMRKHAPGWIKQVVAGGALAFIALSVLSATYAEPWRMLALMLYQLAAFALIAGLVLRRDRADLSAAENANIDRIALSLLLIVPFLASDYRNDAVDFPVRLGGIAILGLCWLALALGRSGLTRRDILHRFGWVFAFATLAGWIAAEIGALDLRAGLQVGAVFLALLLLLAVAQASAALAVEHRQNTVLRHLAEAELTDATTFLRALHRHAGVEEAALLVESDLGDFDLDVLQRLFRAAPVRAAGAAPDQPEADADQLRWLFQKYEASHVLMVSHSPLTLLALSHPSFAGSQTAMLELRAVQRMAALIGQGGAQ